MKSGLGRKLLSAAVLASSLSALVPAQAGLVVSGRSVGAEALCETVELPNHRWFFGCQFHPEFTSTPRDGHPLFTSFVNAALANKK